MSFIENATPLYAECFQRGQAVQAWNDDVVGNRRSQLDGKGLKGACRLLEHPAEHKKARKGGAEWSIGDGAQKLTGTRK